MAKKINNKKQDSLTTLKTTLTQKEFWVGLITTFIVLAVSFKLIPWNSLSILSARKSNVVSPIPTKFLVMTKGATSIASVGAYTTATPAASLTPDIALTPVVTVTPKVMSVADNKPLKKKVNTLADTSGYYTVQEDDNYYTIAVNVCGNGKLFESIQAENNSAPLFAGNQITVTCFE